MPNLVSCFRLLLVPVLVGLAWNGCGRAFFICLIASLVTDMTDGMLARSLKQTTAVGAKLDSWADFITCLALPFCAWWLRPEVVRQEALFLGTGIFFYLAATLAGVIKFKGLTSYHTWGAKISAVLFGAAVMVLFAGGPGWVFRWVMPIIILAEIEEIAITAVLSRPAADVPSLWHAARISRRAGNERRRSLETDRGFDRDEDR